MLRPLRLVAPLALVTLAVACSDEPPIPDPVGRWEFVPAATIDANKNAIIALYGEEGPDRLEVAMSMLKSSFEASEMHFEFAADGTFTGHRSQPYQNSSAVFERAESGTWQRTAPESGDLVLVIADPEGGDWSEERSALVAGDRLEVVTPQGPSSMTFVFERAR